GREFVDGGTGAVVYHELVARGEQIAGHGLAHDAQADESDLHERSFRVRRRCAAWWGGSVEACAGADAGSERVERGDHARELLAQRRVDLAGRGDAVPGVDPEDPQALLEDEREGGAGDEVAQLGELLLE